MNRSNARGATLLISLIFLTVLVLLGLTAARVAIMQERMAGNVREYNTAFQSAEATLREIEQRLVQVAYGSSGGLGIIPMWSQFDLNRSDCSLQLQADNEWDNWATAPWRTAPTTENDYIVIDLGPSDDGTGVPVGSACRPVSEAGTIGAGSYFLIVARAVGPAGAGETVVQSIFFWPN
jgi:Tfp pilus assembly protein PilX